MTDKGKAEVKVIEMTEEEKLRETVKGHSEKLRNLHGKVEDLDVKVRKLLKLSPDERQRILFILEQFANNVQKGIARDPVLKTNERKQVSEMVETEHTKLVEMVNR